MNKRFLVFLSFVIVLFVNGASLNADLVILNDSENYHGHFSMTHEGFLLGLGKWNQAGVNVKSKYIGSNYQDFVPAITNEGRNLLVGTYESIGWLWPAGSGTVDSASYLFLTDGIIISLSPIGDVVAEQVPNLHIDLLAFHTSPASISFNKQVSYSFSRSESTQIIHSEETASTFEITGTIANLFSMKSGVSASVTEGVSKELQLTETISNTISLGGSIPSYSFDSNHYVAMGQLLFWAHRQDYNVSFYVDSDNDGCCNSNDIQDGKFGHYFDFFASLGFVEIPISRSF